MLSMSDSDAPQTVELRIVRKITKIEVGLVARYCTIVSTDKLVEALAFPLINQTEQTAIETELNQRLRDHNSRLFAP